MQPTHNTYYSYREEQLNVWSHALGFGLSILGLFFLIKSAINHDTLWHWIGYITYGLSQVTVFGASTMYHSAREDEKRRRLNILDHASIYISIAGTYTPFMLIVIRGPWGWSILGTVWSMAIAGIILKLFFTGRYNLWSTISYVIMGWVLIIAIKPLIEHLQLAGLLWIAAGGLLYTLGAILYQIKKIPYNHAIFHFFVLTAAICNYIAVYKYAV